MMRGGALDEPPLCIAFPAAVAADVVKGLGEARLDGEEEYGDTVVPRVRAMGMIVARFSRKFPWIMP